MLYEGISCIRGSQKLYFFRKKTIRRWPDYKKEWKKDRKKERKRAREREREREREEESWARRNEWQGLVDTFTRLFAIDLVIVFRSTQLCLRYGLTFGKNRKGKVYLVRKLTLKVVRVHYSLYNRRIIRLAKDRNPAVNLHLGLHFFDFLMDL